MNTYQRVIPRDFFNEAKLLKCMGQLALRILDNELPYGINISIEECGEAFEIDRSDDNELFVSNYPVTVNGEVIFFFTAYNSKYFYPFYCRNSEGDEFTVFDSDGCFSSEFIAGFEILVK